MSPSSILVKEKIIRDDGEKLKHPSYQAKSHEVIIIGAGLGGLGAAISISLEGHDVTVLESAPEIAEIGAGIQILPQSTLILRHWSLLPVLLPHSTTPSCVNMRSHHGPLISSMNFAHSASQYPGTCYLDLHRADLHRALYRRALELGATVRCGVRVTDVQCRELDAEVLIENGESMKADLVVPADGVFSKMREVMLGRVDPPVETGDLAYRLLLDTRDMMKDPNLKEFVEKPQVNYWLGRDMHVVNYVLRNGSLFNMVLLVPDNMPAGAKTLEGNVEEMRALFKDWDPRISKLLSLCKSVYKWRLCIRPNPETWSHPSGHFTMLEPLISELGDAAHASLPYLAAGASMALEDAAVLGQLLSHYPVNNHPSTRSLASKTAFLQHALHIYQAIRGPRTEKVVQRGTTQQYLYHLPDGPEQIERDRKMREQEGGEALAWRDKGFAPWLLGYDYITEVSCWNFIILVLIFRGNVLIVEKHWRELETTKKERGKTLKARI
ncbi:FAD dependent oxidoreductase protein [Rutstroemia sp. NJR-2017a WRK4]|nr:FAD dependent oxidoreductase protein [Rutstroemia sp. NJR-2017a WRK4]